MAKRRKGAGSARGRFQVWPVDQAVALSTLGSDTVIKQVLVNLTQDVYLNSSDLIAYAEGMTAGEGPLLVGLCDNDLTVTEIAEALAAAPPSQSARIERERATRPVRTMGVIINPGTGLIGAVEDGKKLRVPIKWFQGAGADIAFFIQNKGAAALTTGSVAKVTGKLYGTWR